MTYFCVLFSIIYIFLTKTKESLQAICFFFSQFPQNSIKFRKEKSEHENNRLNVKFYTKKHLTGHIIERKVIQKFKKWARLLKFDHYRQWKPQGHSGHISWRTRVKKPDTRKIEREINTSDILKFYPNCAGGVLD